jgi:glucosamine-phosphate N-acetyltransferase
MIINIKNLELNQTHYNEIIQLYSNFSKIDETILDFKNLKSLIERLPQNHNIYFYLENNKIVGAITLIIEEKIIHSGGKVGHIEDFVVLDEYRNKGIGSLLYNYVKILCEQNKCYKMILDCNELLENYYIKKGFIKKGSYMAYYF